MGEPVAIAAFPTRLRIPTIGDLIRAEREEKGDKQEWCAARIGRTRRTWINWEGDHTRPDLDDVKALCRLYPSLKVKLLSP